MTLTGHKTFDKQCHGGLITGNVFGDAQLSWYIRPRHQTECNGFVFAPGELLAADLKVFNRLPQSIAKFIEGLNRRVILNEIRHWTGPKRRREKRLHGFIVTEGHDRGHQHIRTFQVGGGVRSPRILEAVTPSLTGRKAS
jgi:hypothetical protein